MASFLATKMLPQLVLLLVSLLVCPSARAFSPSGMRTTTVSVPKPIATNRVVPETRTINGSNLHMASTDSSSSSSAATATVDADSAVSNEKPQVLASGFSQNMDMVEALREAVDMALASLPPTPTGGIDLAVVSVSSLYDGNASPSLVVPTILEAASSYGTGVQHLVGSTCGGFISSSPREQTIADDDDETTQQKKKKATCAPVEREGVPGVSVVLSILPDVRLRTFHVDDVPDDYGKMTSDSWKESIGLLSSSDEDDDEPVAMVFPSPAMTNDLDDLLKGMDTHLPGCRIFGSVASTVSSLSRARLFRYDVNDDTQVQTLADGCVGVVMEGDIALRTMIAKGAKPVGGVYKIVKGEASTIFSVALDEAATELAKAAEELEEDEEEEEEAEQDFDGDERKARAAKMAAAYAKARIPKPVLAEANFVMKTLSDDDQAFMKKYILVGVERNGTPGQTPSELGRLAEGKGHGYAVHQVASASMKDGSVTLSLGSVDIEQGIRMRFFVRDSEFAKKELAALLTGYNKRTLPDSTGCFVFPTLDRGSKFFNGKPGFESSTISEFLPSVPCVSGFFGNGVIGAMGTDPESSSIREPARMNGSASGYFLIGSKTKRPIYSPTKPVAFEEEVVEEDEEPVETTKSSDLEEKAAPRDERGELVIRRREVSSGRALTVSTVEWSVAENMATPTSSLEGFMWDKETEVDRFRERVPLANLLSQCKLSMVDPTKPKPRDWIGPVKAAAEKGFVLIPDCKRTEPATGSLRKRYDVSKMAKEFTTKGACAISVNCDQVLFGGSLEDLTKAREASSSVVVEKSSSDDSIVVPPILASDLLLYPYQLYKMRLAGADAVNLIVGALAAKDLVYLTKIASSLDMQSMLTVTSTAQIENLNILAAGGIGGLIVSNRELEDFSFDTTGRQALEILESDELKAFKENHGDDIPVLVEGRVGIIKAKDNEGNETAEAYIKQLHDAGATGAVVGSALATGEFDVSFTN